ncbi:hypothetical protein [Arsenophonus nasoniae]|uniref:Uncharacterized protein n=1 Tax=Arsenophonus nasoniae TaxID=638 RepID=A0A4P7LAF8_9GAMM|nr:hypothetical protein [Arsenophonus nasoniae]QBY46122.1 hypothetical protein ArsFIN_47330 [Arsenophonus nasoniae]
MQLSFREKKAEQQVFNQKLKKAFWRHENPRQQLRDFQTTDSSLRQSVYESPQKTAKTKNHRTESAY